MPNILLISSHYPPSNLTATHRVRLFAKHLPMFGWNPIVLTVDEKIYEEKPDLVFAADEKSVNASHDNAEDSKYNRSLLKKINRERVSKLK
jgi:hypothetical protein